MNDKLGWRVTIRSTINEDRIARTYWGVSRVDAEDFAWLAWADDLTPHEANASTIDVRRVKREVTP